jgi:hypothetical protein
MKDRRDYTERRQHARANVQNIVVGILSAGEPETIGSIADISLGGVKYIYNELRIAPPRHPIHSIDLIADNHYLFDLPCESAWDIKAETESDSKLTDIRQCGIRFGKLTPNQIFSLRSFINRCASLGINGTNSNFHKTDSE